MDNTFEKEQSLLQEYHVLTHKVNELGTVKDLSNSLSNEMEKELSKAIERKDALIHELINLEEHPVTKQNVLIVIHNLQKTVDILIENVAGHKILRNQSTADKNAVFSNVKRDIGLSYNPAYMVRMFPQHYYYSPLSQFDHNPLKKLLIEFRENIKSQPPINHIELELLLNYYKDKIDCLAANI